jgi:hypothetical protein
MRLLAATLLICLLLLSAAARTFDNCSCNAKDGTCSANISCAGGCIAVCPGGGNTCRATCSGGGGGSGYGEIDYMMAVSMQTDSDTNTVAAELARITGRPVVFIPANGNTPISLDVKRAALWDVLEILSASGKIEIGGDDFSKLQNIRKALVTGEKMSICVHNASVQRVVNEFASLSGLSIRVTSGNPKTIVTLSASDASLEEFLSQLAKEGGVEISTK